MLTLKSMTVAILVLQIGECAVVSMIKGKMTWDQSLLLWGFNETQAMEIFS